MIKQVYEADKHRVLDVLKEDPSRALFIVGDILNYGMHRSFQDVWIDEDEEGICGVYLRYRNNLVMYINKCVKDVEGLEKIIALKNIDFISATKSHFEKLSQHILDKITLRETFFCECTQFREHSFQAERATLEDIPSIVDGLMLNFNTYQGTREERIAHMTLDFQENDKAIFIIKDKEQVVSAASSSAKSDRGVMVVGVFTLEAYRKKGYARQVVSALTKWAIDENLVPCLFYDNPDAGKLYHDIGYSTFDTWVLGSKKI